MQTCSSCRWFTPNIPREIPEVRTHVSILGVKFRRDHRSIRLDEMFAAGIATFNNGGLCRRHPETLRKYRDDYCGEHKERTGDD